MYDIFGKYGSIRQIRLGNSNQTRGTAYVVYDDIFEAKTACENLNGLHVGGMYLIVSSNLCIFYHLYGGRSFSNATNQYFPLFIIHG